jgi:hypothetical protein
LSSEFPCKVLVRELQLIGVPDRFRENAIVNIMKEHGSVEQIDLNQGVAYIRYGRVRDATSAFEAAPRIFALLGSP